MNDLQPEQSRWGCLFIIVTSLFLWLVIIAVAWWATHR